MRATLRAVRMWKNNGYTARKRTDSPFLPRQSFGQVNVNGMDTRETEIDRTLEKVDLLAYKERHPLSLSGGQMQRLAVVVSDICGKELLVFDEPISGLDLKSMEEVGILTRSLATQGKVLLIITHYIEVMMRICTRILFIRDGEIVEDLSGGQKEKIVRLLRGEE